MWWIDKQTYESTIMDKMFVVFLHVFPHFSFTESKSELDYNNNNVSG